ncbi:MAG: ATP-binding protein [Cyclobacteriaceae bacterium]|nr:ATP-binding protein [Cyclobacteriaceae bacterium]
MMLYKINTVFICITLILVSLSSLAQYNVDREIQNYFNEINVEHGLSAANVNAIGKDSLGFMWFGTVYGLNRYDGNSFKVFLASDTIKNSLSSNMVYDIITDKNGNIWVATLEGINKYQHLTENFKVYKDDSTSNIYSDIDYDTLSNRIWIAAGFDGIKYVDLEKDTLVHCTLDIIPINIKAFEDKLLVGTNDKGLIILDKSSYEILKIIKTPFNSSILSILIVKDEIWVGTEKDGIYKIHNDNITYYNSKNSDFISNGALSLEEDKRGNLLIGTDGMGLFVYNHKKDKFYQIAKSDNPNNLKADAIRSVYVDDLNNIWLGTYAEGVNIQPFYNRTIINYQKDIYSNNSLSNSFVLATEESKNGKLYIGTDRGGLNILENSKFSNVKISGGVVLSLYEDVKERLWVGTYQSGIYLYEDNKLTNFADIINDSTFNSSSVWSITEGSEGNIWLALTHYLIKVNVDDYSYSLFENKYDDPNSVITNSFKPLFKDSQGRLWIGTMKGLSVYSPSKNKFISNNENRKTLTNRQITVITESDSNFYVGTYGSGIYVLNNNMELIDSLTRENNGLVHNVVVDIVIDDNGNIWATTPNGISKINKETFKAENFTTSDGIIGNTFNMRSGRMLSSGHLALGSTQGLTLFYPDSIAYNTLAPSTILTELKVLNDVITIESDILEKPITFTKSFTLPPQFNALSISYVGLNYENPKKVIYKYILEGFEDEWRIAGKNTTASYTNLSPGNYTFKVMASNGNNFWTPTPATVEITILPQWWQTTLARIILLLLAIVAPILIIKIRTSTLSKQKDKLKRLVKERTNKLENAYDQLTKFNSELELRVKERTEKLEKSNKELDRFVYSASHDLSAPLKSIVGLLNLAKMDYDSEASFYLNKIGNSILKLEDVIKNLIQFSRNSMQEVKVEEIDFHEMKKELQEDLIYSASNKDTIEFTSEVIGDISLVTDPVRLKVILSNFISNALKYRKENDTCKIYLCVYKEGDTIVVSVEDNGIGIENEYLDKIFDMFFRGSSTSDGSGLGLFIVKEAVEKLNATIDVTSTVGEGTKFSVLFPKT